MPMGGGYSPSAPPPPGYATEAKNDISAILPAILIRNLQCGHTVR